MAENVVLNEPTVGQRVGARIGKGIDNVIDTYQGAKQHISEKVSKIAAKGKAVNRLRRMQHNRDKEAVKKMFADAKAKAAEFKAKAAEKMKNGAEKVAETSFVLAFGIKELASMGYNAAKDKINGAVGSFKNAINNRVTKAKNKINNGVNKVKTKFNNGVNSVKNFGKKVWKGAKTAAFVTAYVVASPVILPYKAAKWGVKKISNGVKAIRNGYKKLKNRALGITDDVAQDKDTALKQTSSEKKVSRLNAQQVAAAWEQVRDDGNAPLYSKECNSHYNLSGYADRFLEDIKSGKTTLSPENAQLAATFLGISMEVQDKVNHNKVVEKEERNRNIAAQLEQFGIKNPYKTEETQDKEAESQTPPVQEKPKEQEEPAPEKPKEKEIPELNPEQAKLVESQLNVLKTLGQENGLKPTDDMYKGLVDMMERGFAEKGITAEQLGAIRESNPNLFPPKEKEQPAPEQPKEKEQPAPEQPKEAPQPAPEQPKEAPQPAPEQPKEKEQPAPEKTSRREMSPEERAERKKKRDARRIMQAQGRLKPKQSSVKTSEVDPQVLSKALMGNTLE